MTDRRDDISNKVVRNITTAEFLIAGVAVAIAWGVLTTTVEALGQTVEGHGVEHKEDIREIRKDNLKQADSIHSIENDIGIMKANQQHYTEALKKSQAQQQTIIVNQQRILRAVGDNRQ